MDNHLTRRRVLRGAGVAGLAGLAGCSGGDDGGSGSGSTPQAGASGQDGAATQTSTPAESTPARTAESTGEPLTADQSLYMAYGADELESQTSQGAQKDGIPSIDAPVFASPDELTFPDEMAVFGVVRNGVAKAYPRRVLVYHEIVNDWIDGEPVAVTYCPLTGTVLGFERGEATFGVSGLLINNNLVMYDRTTETLWPQIPATGIDGPLAGSSLREFPLVWTSLGAWREQHPDTKVLTTDTGYARRYGDDPYGGGYDTDPLEPTGFYDSSEPMFPTLAETDDRLDAMDIVIGVRTENGALAFDRTALREQGLLTGEIDGKSYLAAYRPALDAAYAYHNPEGAAFEYDHGTIVDADGAEHPPEGLPLDRVMAFDAMWFAWQGYYPATALVR